MVARCCHCLRCIAFGYSSYSECYCQRSLHGKLARDLARTSGLHKLTELRTRSFTYHRHSDIATGTTGLGILWSPLLQGCKFNRRSFCWLWMSCTDIDSFSSYLFSSSLLTPLSQWLQQDLCTTSILRGTNIIFATGILVVLSQLLKVLHPGTDSMRLNLYALALGTFPVSLFYTFLYYTDTGSTFFVLLSFLLAKQRRYLSSGLVRYGVHHIMLFCTHLSI